MRLADEHRFIRTFCKTSGFESFAPGKEPGGVDMVAINVRCLDGVEPVDFKVKKVNGRAL